MNDVILQISKWDIVKFGAIVTAISTIISALITDRIKHNWQRTANSEIEKLKGDISKNTVIITTLLGQQAQVYQKVLEKNIDACQKGWENILLLKATVPPVVSLVYDILLDDEIESGILDEDRGHGTFGSQIRDINHIEFGKKFGEISDKIRQLRPFMTERLSLLFFIYGAFLGRSVYHLADTYGKRKPKSWHSDEASKKLFETVLTPHEVEYIYNTKYPNHSLVTNLMETKIIEEIKNMLSGEKLTGNSIEQVAKLTELLKSVPKK